MFTPKSVVGWILRHLLTQPLVWLWLTLAAVLGPAVRDFARVAIAVRDSQEHGLIYELAFVSILLGCSVVVAFLDRFDELFRRAGPGRRLGAHAAAIAAGGALFGVAGTAVPWLQSSSPGAGATLLLVAALVLAHLTALGVLLLQIPLPAGVRPWLVPGLGWLLPALAGDLSGPLARLPQAFDASRQLAVGISHPSATALGQALAPIMGMILVSLLVASPSPRGS